MGLPGVVALKNKRAQSSSRLHSHSILTTRREVAANLLTMLFLWSMLLLSTTISTVLCVHRSHTSNKCPNGWDPAPHNSHCYFLVDRPMPQNLAQKYCSLLSPHSSLARVKNQEQNNFLQGMCLSWGVLKTRC